MTYLNFLVFFLFVPIVLLLAVLGIEKRGGRSLPYTFRMLPFWVILAIHIMVAVIYTTPWDNYLVASGVWYYNKMLVTGLKFGWVPVEEYVFFVLQTLLTGLLWLVLAVRSGSTQALVKNDQQIRQYPVILLILVWLLGLALFLSVPSGTYLGLILIWSLPPIILQLLFGGDILWANRRFVGAAIAFVTLYLSITDSLAIRSGTWTIAPGQSLQIYLGGALPLEELIFFLVTNTLIVFGITLGLSQHSRVRFMQIIRVLSILKQT
ncbi:MAG: lycopene cyclase domain-containing protein [Omnitrophica WOR_2 bacterium]